MDYMSTQDAIYEALAALKRLGTVYECEGDRALVDWYRQFVGGC